MLLPRSCLERPSARAAAVLAATVCCAGASAQPGRVAPPPPLVLLPALPMEPLQNCRVSQSDGKGDNPGGGRTTQQFDGNQSLASGAALAQAPAVGTTRRQVQYIVSFPNVSALAPAAWGRYTPREARVRLLAGTASGAPVVGAITVRYHGSSFSAVLSGQALEPAAVSPSATWRVHLRSQGTLAPASGKAARPMEMVVQCELPVQAAR